MVARHPAGPSYGEAACDLGEGRACGWVAGPTEGLSSCPCEGQRGTKLVVGTVPGAVGALACLAVATRYQRPLVQRAMLREEKPLKASQSTRQWTGELPVNLPQELAGDPELGLGLGLGVEVQRMHTTGSLQGQAVQLKGQLRWGRWGT